VGPTTERFAPFPWSVARRRGIQEEVDITGISSSEGGGQRAQLVDGGVIFGEMHLRVHAAAQQGAGAAPRADTCTLIAGMVGLDVWAVKATADQDKGGHQGHTIGTPIPIDHSGLPADWSPQGGPDPQSDVETLKTGGFGEGVAALDL